MTAIEQSTTGDRPAILPGDEFDAVVVGAGFAGLYMLYRLRELGLTARVFETAPGVGGTWYWNRYPGARCDIESMQYSYQFSEELQQEWDWPERFAAQPDILAYIEHVAERFDLNRDIQFETRVSAARFDEADNRWVVETDAGQTVRARFLILGVGCLSSVNTPDFEGYDDYKGPIYHTGHWPHDEVDFTGKRVGVIGTGSSAVQLVPLIAEQAEHLYVFQRTANFVVPAQNRPLTDAEVAAVKADYPGLRERARTYASAFEFPLHSDSALDVSPAERHERYEKQWEVGGLAFMGAFRDILTSADANKTIVAFWREKIGAIVKDPATAALLTPDDAFGCKRVCSGTDYYETFNRANVSLVDVSETGVERFTPEGLRAGGQDFALDAIVCATGFDAMTGSVMRIDITGANGLTIQEKWRDGPKTYLGLTIAGFPNMFNMSGPGSPSVLASMVTAAEQHADMIGDFITWMDAHGKARFDATTEAEAAWGEEVNAAAEKTLRTTCNSWHLGSNIPGKPRLFMPYIGGFPKYEEICRDVVADGYRGFTFA